MNLNPDYLVLQKKAIIEAEQKAVLMGLSYESLMEKAGSCVVEEIERSYEKQSIQIICGPGKNGGDGFVIARLLHERGWLVEVMAVEQNKETSPSRGLWLGHVYPLDAAKVASSGIIVDALFGLGLTKPLKGIYEDIVLSINKSKSQVVSVDVPSGVLCDSGIVLGTAVEADQTVTFNFKKPCHVLLPGRNFCGRVVTRDIGLQAPEGQHLFVNHPNLWRNLFLQPNFQSHKYSRGFLCILGGREMTGAARLAAASSRRVGAGLVQIESSPEVHDLYKRECVGVLTKAINTPEEFGSDSRYSAALIGPGSGRNAFTRQAVLCWLSRKKPCVLDADALFVFQGQPQQLWGHLHDQVILVPHEGEFSFLFNFEGSKIERAQAAAKRSGAIVLLKGADTVIAHPSGLTLVQEQGSYDLATGGTGDVLAGMIAGLLAEHMPVIAAAGMAVYAHVRVAQELGFGLIAEDIPDRIPHVFTEILTRD